MELVHQTQKQKYAIIVVGRMGHGKSAFVRMIARQQQKALIKVSASTRSVTDTCSMYKSQFIEMGKDEQIVVFDTPGMDSKSAVYMILEEIDIKVLQEKLNIIGIAIALDIRARDQNQDDKSYLFQFLQMLRIKYILKLHLCFMILTKFDNYYDQEQDNEIAYAQLQKLFERKGLQML